MQEHLRFTLLIIGIFVIGGILLHGMWSIHKNSKKNKRSSFESRNWEPDFEHEDDLEAERPIFDDVGVSKARVIVNPSAEQENEREQQVAADQRASLSLVDDSKNDFDSNKNSPENPTGDEGLIISSVCDIEDEQNIHLSQSAVPLSAADESDRPNQNTVVNGSNDDRTSASETLPSAATQASDNKVVLEQVNGAENVEDTEPPPVYSNVVTQPKPEYSKPLSIKETKDTEFGHPPGFLLKKGDEPSGVLDASDNSKREVSASASNIRCEIQAEKPSSTDFSLNIQEGPIAQKAKNPSDLDTQVGHQFETKINEVPLQPISGVEKELSFAEQAKRFVRRNKKSVADKIRKEPVLKNGPADDQMRIDFEQSATKAGQTSPSASSALAKANQTAAKTSNNDESGTPSTSPATDVLVLNVRANNDVPIEGATLLPMLLTLGFKFGEHDIFHRHVNTNGKGPILFSLTNMFKPGVFDIDKLENFNTLGLSLFMMLPIDGDAQQVFNMMHNAARKLSDEFDCRILDGNKVGLSKQSLQQYVERIREFERMRLNR